MKATIYIYMCTSLSQLLLATHAQLSSQLLTSLIMLHNYVYIVRLHMFIYTYVYIVQKRLSPPITWPCHAHKVDTSPAFRQYHAEDILYTTPIIFNWELGQYRCYGNLSVISH